MIVSVDQYVSQWLDYCDGNKSFDYSHFLGLLSGRPTNDQLQVIFNRVPEKDLILNRLSSVYNHAVPDASNLYLKSKPPTSNAIFEVENILERFFKSQKRYLLENDINSETRNWLRTFIFKARSVELTEIDDLKMSGRNLDHHLLSEEHEFNRYSADTGLKITSGLDPDYRLMSGIREALYGLATDYRLVYYVLSPILETKIDYDLYLELWKSGSQYAFSNTECLICNSKI